jgi:hypothetical protein
VYDYLGGFIRDWVSAGLDDKALYLAVCVACASSVVRGALVARRLFRPGARRGTLTELLADPSLSADEIAQLGLAGAVLPPRGPSAPEMPASAPGADRRLDAAQARFTYLWSLAEARMGATCGLLCAAVLMTLLASVGRLEFLIAYGHGSPWWHLFDGLYRLTVRLSVMLPMCLVICAIWAVFSAALRRRRATWRYAVDTTLAGPPVT